MARQTRTASSSGEARHLSRPKARELWLLALILVVGAGLRVAYLAELRSAPDLEHPPVDGGFTLYWARALATGDWSLPPDAAGRDPRIREVSYIRPPGYAYVLAGLYRLSDGNQLIIRGIQLTVGLVSVVLGWLLGRLLLGPPAGLAGAGLTVACWTPMYFEGGINENGIVVALTLALVLQLRRAMLRPKIPQVLAAGCLLGLTALFRSNVLLFAPVALAWYAWALRRAGRFSRRRFVRLALAGGLGAVAMLAGVMARNLRVEGALVPVSADAGLVLYRGNNDDALGISTSRLGRFGRLDSPWAIPDVVARVEARTGGRLTFAEASRQLGREAVNWIAHHPGPALALVARRAALFWGPHEIAHNRAVASDRQRSPVLRRMPVSFAVAAGGALAGFAVLVVSYRRRGTGDGGLRWQDGSLETLVLIGLFVAMWSVSFLPFLVTSLYRAPVIPYLLLGLAAVLVEIGTSIRARPLSAAAWAGTLAAAILLAHIPIVPVDDGLARWHFDRGLAWVYQGDAQRAEASFRSALAESPSLWTAHNGLGKLALDAGDAAQAERHFRHASELEPESPVAHSNLGLALVRRRRWAEAAAAFANAVRWAPTDAEAWMNLGICHEQQGRLADARQAYEGALAGRRPVGAQTKQSPGGGQTQGIDHRRAANNLAWLLATAPDADLRDGATAVTLAEGVVAAGADPGALDTLAAAYAEAGRFTEAVATGERAIAGAGGRDGDFEREAASRLALYRQGRAYRQP